jgi:uncharacterized membrane protein YkoI
MLKKVLAGTGIAAVLTAGFLLGSLTLGPVFAQTQHTNPPAQTVVQSPSDDDTAEAKVKEADMDEVDEQVEEQTEVDEQSQYTGSIQVDDAQYDGMSEADEAAALQSKATISAADAETAALAANPGATVVKTELDNENGSVVYSVELSNGNDVKVDAGNGQILHTEVGGVDSEGEVEGQETIED